MAHYKEIHPRFRLNGRAFSADDLREVGYSLVKEGEDFEQEIGDFLLEWVSDSEQITTRTSGSTGPPKLRTIKKQQMVRSALATGNFFNLNPGNSALLCLPSRFIAGKMMLVRAMVLGLSLDYVPPRTQPLEDLTRQYDFCAMVPGQFLKSIEMLPHIRILIIGGAPLGGMGIKEAQSLSTEIYETFGMTETISHIALRRINPLNKFFRTLPNIRVATDSRGCLTVYAPEFADVPIQTNDLVHLVSETEFEWLGRVDNVINSGGIKLIPEMIEQKLQPFISGRFFVSGLADEILGEKLVLILEAEKPPKNLLEKLHKEASLEKNELPKEIHIISAFANTESGKVNRPATLSALSILKSAKP